MRLWGLLLLTACSAGSPTRVQKLARPFDAGTLQDAGGDVTQEAAEVDAQPDAPAVDAAPDAPPDAPADAAPEATVDAGWLPPDGASSNAMLGARCDGAGNPCTGLYPAWSETSGRYYLLSCELGPDAISSLCTFECDDEQGYKDPAKAADCVALGGMCEMGGVGSPLFCFK